MAELADLDILFPGESNSISFTGKDGEKYVIQSDLHLSITSIS